MRRDAKSVGATSTSAHDAARANDARALAIALANDPTLLDRVDALRRTPLHLAAHVDGVEAIELLCDRGARVSAEAMGATIDKVVWVPGTYEAPLVVENMLQDPTLDACVVLGYIEKGSTLHGQEMGATFSIIAKQLELEYGKPVGMGIIGPGATAEQAEMRVAYAGNAVRASVRMARTFVPAEEDVETA